MFLVLDLLDGSESSPVTLPLLFAAMADDQHHAQERSEKLYPGTESRVPFLQKQVHCKLIEVIELKAAFDGIDKDGSKRLSKDEIAKVMRRLGSKPTDDLLDDFMDTVDANRDGQVDWAEFVDAVASNALYAYGFAGAFTLKNLSMLGNDGMAFLFTFQGNEIADIEH